jgi:hypothetical protein
VPADEFAVHLDRRAALAHCPREHADNPLREGDVRRASGSARCVHRSCAMESTVNMHVPQGGTVLRLVLAEQSSN